MKIILDRKSLPEFQRRLEKISPQSARKWGGLSPLGMLAHLRQSLVISLGDIPIKDHSNFFFRIVVKRLVLYLLPMPKGRIKTDAVFMPAPEGDAAAERARVVADMERFVTAAEREPQALRLHPAFGLLTLREWQCLHGKHMDHHLNQFGA
jgi:hypothetical protein